MQSSCLTGQDEAPLPHLAGDLCFPSPSKYPSPLSFRGAMMGPTPRKMAAVGGRTPSKSHSRRCSSIPRPASKLTGLRISPLRAAGVDQDMGKTIAKDTPQTIVKPRTYSRNRQSTFVLNGNGSPSSCKVPTSQPPRLSLPAITSPPVDGANDLSGIRQQLPMMHYSRHSLASLDALVSSGTNIENNIATALPLPSRLTIILSFGPCKGIFLLLSPIITSSSSPPIWSDK